MRKYSGKFRIWESAALAAVCIALLAATWAQSRQSAISAELLRLHVVAAGDEKEEQEIKLIVRDAVLEYLDPVLRETKSPDEAESIISENLRGIAAAAGAAAEGRPVSVSLGRENFPTREYEGFSLPAGNYRSLKIVLGEGEGRNWWCIVFPPLCLEGAQAQQVQSVMSRQDYAIVSEAEGYELRFKMVELWGEFLRTVCGK